MRNSNALPILIFVLLLGAGLSFSYASLDLGDPRKSALIALIAATAALIVSYSVKIANQWERVVVLRLGRFSALKGPGLFLIVPIIDVVAYWIDIRVITTAFKAEKTLAKDTVPVDVDAVLFWKVVDPGKAALDVADYESAINWAAQTALRDVYLGGGKRRADPVRLGRRHVYAGASGTRTPGARNPRRLGASNRREVRRGGEDLRR
jgi:hypothetical protein